MSIRIVLLLMILVVVKKSLAQESSDVFGVWRAEQTYCSSPNSQNIVKTQIVGQPWLGFEPVPSLKIYEKDGKKYIQKDVEKESCLASKVNTDNFISSLHEVEISANTINGQTIYGMKAKKFIYGIVNTNAILKCGNILQSFVLYSHAHIKFPQYFHQEGDRPYHMAVHERYMYVMYKENEICKDANTVTVFRKVAGSSSR